MGPGKPLSMARGVGAFAAGFAHLAVRPSTLCFCDGRFVVPLPLLWGCLRGGLSTHPHVGGLPGVCPLPSGPLLCSGSVHVLGTVSDQTRFACLGFGRLRYGTQSLRGGKFYRLQVFHTCSRRPEELGTNLCNCVRLAGQFPPPQHLYSHRRGTFLDLVLDDVDREAKAQALRQPHPVPAGYLAGLQVPQPAFCRFGVQ